MFVLSLNRRTRVRSAFRWSKPQSSIVTKVSIGIAARGEMLVPAPCQQHCPRYISDASNLVALLAIG